MSNKFTPGPWIVTPPGHGNQTECLCVQLGENEMYTTLEILPDDANLIAAAPDGYKAAESAYLTLLKVKTFEDRLSDGFQESLIHLRDFIAKATDRTSEDVQNEFEAKARGEQ